MQKLNQNLPHYSFRDVKDILTEIHQTDGEFAEVYDIYSLIYWLKEDVIQAEFYAHKTLKLCPDKFSTSNHNFQCFPLISSNTRMPVSCQISKSQ